MPGAVHAVTSDTNTVRNKKDVRMSGADSKSHAGVGDPQRLIDDPRHDSEARATTSLSCGMAFAAWIYAAWIYAAWIYAAWIYAAEGCLVSVAATIALTIVCLRAR